MEKIQGQNCLWNQVLNSMLKSKVKTPSKDNHTIIIKVIPLFPSEKPSKRTQYSENYTTPDPKPSKRIFHLPTISQQLNLAKSERQPLIAKIMSYPTFHHSIFFSFPSLLQQPNRHKRERLHSAEQIHKPIISLSFSTKRTNSKRLNTQKFDIPKSNFLALSYTF